MPKILVLVGPTSSGKTSLALELCKLNSGVIISADSRQIYKEMDIGTGKLPITNSHKIEKLTDAYVIDGVKVYGYDLASPDENFSGYDYAKYALEIIRTCLSQNKKVVIVGGTGFYIDLLTGRQKLDSSAPDLNLRSELETLELSVLLEKLQNVNPEVFKTIDKNNRVRVTRAIEKQYAASINSPLNLLTEVEFNFYGLTGPRDYLYTRADAWVDYIWANRLLKETKSLLYKYPTSIKLQGLVYKTVVTYLTGNIDEKEAIQRIKWDIHAYIRRQQTWFKKNSDIKWLDISADSQKECILKLQTYE